MALVDDYFARHFGADLYSFIDRVQQSNFWPILAAQVQFNFVRGAAGRTPMLSTKIRFSKLAEQIGGMAKVEETR